jgi:hypothetical protein
LPTQTAIDGSIVRVRAAAKRTARPSHTAVAADGRGRSARFVRPPRLRDRHARFARPDDVPAARRAVPSGGGVARFSSTGRRATNAGSGATGFFRPPRTRASSVACVFSGSPARHAFGFAIQRVGACRARKGGGVSGISAHSSRGRGGGGLGALGNAVCILARAITASQSSSSSTGAAAGRKRAATRCSGTLAMVSSLKGSGVVVRLCKVGGTRPPRWLTLCAPQPAITAGRGVPPIDVGPRASSACAGRWSAGTSRVAASSAHARRAG